MDAIVETVSPNSSRIIVIASLLTALTLVTRLVLYRWPLTSFPGPLFARVSDLWLAWHTARGTVNRAVWDAHRVYGPFVRIAPNHVSIADVSALHAIYGHNVGILKSDFYEVFASFHGRKSIFSTRSREEHARKRRILSHTFSQRSTLEFEPVVQHHLVSLIKQWDHMCSEAAEGRRGITGDMAWTTREGHATFDVLKWCNFMIFDVIGELVFQAPFGMTKRGSDTALIAKSEDKAISSYGSTEAELEYDSVRAVEAINKRSTFIVTLGMLPLSWRPLFQKLPLPWVRGGNGGIRKISSLAVTAVANHTKQSSHRSDILSKYFDATDERGKKMDNFELSSEAHVLLVAGSDTTSNSVAAITFYVAHNPTVRSKLQAELDRALGAPGYDVNEDEPKLAPYETVKKLPYLQDVVNEGLRLFSTVGMGLPRIVPQGGLAILGQVFPPGTIVSVPTYVLHRDHAIWGEDADSFNPDRWLRGDKAAMSKAFAPFSVGPRACIGRNLASMELLIIIANIFHKFEIGPASESSREMDIWDGFTRKPLACIVSVKRRDS